MNAVDIAALAHHLFEAHGAKAIAEAAQRAAAFQRAGDEEQSNTWRRVEAVLWELRDPHES